MTALDCFRFYFKYQNTISRVLTSELKTDHVFILLFCFEDPSSIMSEDKKKKSKEQLNVTESFIFSGFSPEALPNGFSL